MIDPYVPLAPGTRLLERLPAAVAKALLAVNTWSGIFPKAENPNLIHFAPSPC